MSGPQAAWRRKRRELRARVKAEGRGPSGHPTGAELMLMLVEAALSSPDKAATEAAYHLGRLDGDKAMAGDRDWSRGRAVAKGAAEGGKGRSEHARNLGWLAELEAWRASNPHLRMDTRFHEQVARREGLTPRAVRNGLNSARSARKP